MSRSIKGSAWNINGVQGKMNLIRNLMKNESIDWMFVSETWLGQGSRPWEMDAGDVVALVDGIRPAGRGRPQRGLALVINKERGWRRDMIAEIARSPESLYGVWKISNTIIIGVYLPPSLDIESAVAVVEEAIDKIPRCWRDLPRIITGDMNARIRHVNHRQGDSRGRDLKQALERRGLQIIIPGGRGPGDTNTTTTGSSANNNMVDWFCTDQQHADNASVSIIRHSDGHSDHRAIVGEYSEQRMEEPQHSPKSVRWKISKLVEDGTRSRLSAKLEETLTPVREAIEKAMLLTNASEFQRQLCIDRIAESLTKAVYKAADGVLGRLTDFMNGKSRRFQSELVRERQLALQRLSTDPLEQGESRNMRKTRQQEALRQLMAAKRNEVVKEWLPEFLQKQDNLSHAELLTSFRKRKANKKKTVQPGECQLQLDEMANDWEQHFTPWKTADGSEPMKLEPADRYAEDDLGDPLEASTSNWRVQKTDVIRALKFSALIKAAGLDGITKELLGLPRGKVPEREWEGNHVVCTLTEFFSLIVQLGVVPSNWSDGVMVMIPKKGTSRERSNLRPITLLPLWRKLFEKSCLQEKIVMNGFHRYQGGFCARKSTLDMVATLDHAARICKRKKRQPVMAFLDIKAAYDAVDRNILYQRLRERGTDEKVVRLIQRLLSRSTGAIVADGRTSRRFKLQAGVPQGSTISPLLFNAFLDILFEELERLESTEEDLKTAQGTILRACGYADDVALIALSLRRMQALLNCCERVGNLLKIRWSPPKSVVVTQHTGRRMKIYNQPLLQEDKFKYLGVWFATEGILVADQVASNCEKAKRAMDAMRALGLEARTLAAHKATLIFKSFVVACAEYGLAVAVLEEVDIKKLDKTMRKLLIRLLGGCHSTNGAVLMNVANVAPYTVRADELAAKWIVRAVKSEERRSILKDWLSDALCDRESPLRKKLEENKVLAAAGLEQRLPFGAECRAAWSWEEVAAVQFRLRRNRPWRSCARDVEDPFRSVADWNITEKIIKEVREGHWDELKSKAVTSGKLAYLRDLPPCKEPLLKALKNKRWQRLAICWWTGLIPGHDDKRCGACGELIFDLEATTGARAHVAECVIRRHPMLRESVEQELPAWRENTTRHTEDGISKLIWRVYSEKRFAENDEFAQLTFNAIELVSVECLGRARGE